MAEYDKYYKIWTAYDKMQREYKPHLKFWKKQLNAIDHPIVFMDRIKKTMAENRILFKTALRGEHVLLPLLAAKWKRELL